MTEQKHSGWITFAKGYFIFGCAIAIIMTILFTAIMLLFFGATLGIFSELLRAL